MKLNDLSIEYEALQLKYGDPSLDAVINGGCSENPDFCFVFMNPTGKNVASQKSWKGIKSPWLGTKNIWELFHKINLVSDDLYDSIASKKREDWDEKFAEEVYENVSKRKYFITNLGKCTQIDARPIPDRVYKEYLHLLLKEIEIVNPKVIVLFGNQVSSIVLGQKVSVSQCRKQLFKLEINGKMYNTYSVYYPVGNGRFNMGKSVEDLIWIINSLK